MKLSYNHALMKTMTAKILIIDDEISIRHLLSATLQQADFDTSEATDATTALEQLVNERPDLILLDWMLPETSGPTLAKRLKRDPDFADIPIIMLTARGEEENRVHGLESGVDDYVTKPFSNRELVLRIQAVLRRLKPHLLDQPLQQGRLKLDPASHRVTVDNQELALAPTEYKLLLFFMSHANKVYSREQLLNRVWGGNVYVEDRTVDVHILRLRKVLKPMGQDHLIETVRGSGYRFTATS